VNSPLVAVISKEWKQRMLLMTAIIAGAGCWFLYDGLVGYPNSNVRAAVYFPLKEKYGKDSPELEKAWADEARARGWSDTPPKKKYNDWDIHQQLGIAVISFLGAAACLVNFAWSLKTTTRYKDGIIILPNGQRIPAEKVRSISMRRWKNKGIADLVYEAGPGRMKKFLLDDYKYIGVEQILKEVEKFVPQDSPSEAPAPKPEAGHGDY
jgi:hypothetical protein